MSLKTSYEFVLPRGYIDYNGVVHREGRMRLATARDELEPLRDPLISGPDDPRLTILVLTRVIEKLGAVPIITASDIEGLFAVDLAYLQDFYGVINFGTQAEYEALLRAQQSSSLVGGVAEPATAEPAPIEDDEPEDDSPTDAAETSAAPAARPNLRRAVEELPRQAL
ncbi:MAG TPA: hypothetical protein VGL26_03590 [Jatrophihabitans sp.]